MNPEFRYDEPLPSKNDHETAAFAQERSLGDVVQPRSSLGPRFHLDRLVEFDATAPSGYPRRLTRDHAADHYFHLDDSGSSRSGTEAQHNDHDRTDDDASDDARSIGAQRDERRNDPVGNKRQSRLELVQRDRFERQVERERLRRERLERRRQRSARSDPLGGRRAAAGSRNMGGRDERPRVGDPDVRGDDDRGRDPVRDRRSHAVPGNDHRPDPRSEHHVGTSTEQLSRPLSTRLHGAALALYFALLPYVVLTKWQRTSSESSGAFIRLLLVVLVAFWLGFLCQVALNVWRLRRGRQVKSGGSAWLAGLLVPLLALAAPTHVNAHQPSAIAISYQSTSQPVRHRAPTPLVGLAPMPLALVAKRRSDALRRDGGDDLFDVDESIELLRGLDPQLIGHLVALIGEDRDGVLDVADEPVPLSSGAPTAAILACTLGPSATGTLIGFAREGGRLPIRAAWSADDIQREVVVVHQGTVVFARDESELLRALATRALRGSVVVYLGPSSDLDDELSACAVTLTPYLEHDSRIPTHVACDAPRTGDLRVEMLRADPTVVGIVEPFTPTLRRRCIEMVAYLALHRHEPVTGERLRTRVLLHADIEASSRTLANTASSVRRSLGVDVQGPRLHPVSSSGLYATHGVTSDVEMFSTLVARARQLPLGDAASLAHEALLLIKGEPLASTLRGFEWFLAEGFAARLARDGEWAALALHHSAMGRRNYELAFWSLQQGLLIDPYSDALTDALAKVPRLREFGGDGARPAQHQPVSPRGAVAMSWSLTGLSQQIFQ
jgi:hypothetical protein